jgi:CSLREA domain-containing protein
LNNATLSNNSASSDGGGIFNYGNLILNDTTISNNSASSVSSSGSGGGIYQWSGSLTLNNTTVSNNSTGYSGGGIYQYAGSLELNNTTVSSNSARHSGGGILKYYGSLSISNSILGGNTSNLGPDCDANWGVITSGGHNLISNTFTCGITAADGDQFNVDPGLGTFLPEQGYHPLLSSSPAINAGNPVTCLPTDQRGAARAGTCDSGAYEYTASGLAARLSVVSGNDQRTRPLQAFSQPLQVVALDGQGSPVANVSVTFTAPDGGPSGTFTASGTNTMSALTNASGIATASTFTANAEFGAYQVSASASGLTSTNFNLQNANMIVNTAVDEDLANGSCSLREAILAANTNANYKGCPDAGTYGVDTIAFADNYTITLAGSQLPAVTSEIVITGNGAANTIIQAKAVPQTDTYRVFQVKSTGNLTLVGLTIRNGSCTSSCASPYYEGGGIHNTGTLTVTNSTVSGNSASRGGGIYNTGTLTVTNSTVSNNTSGGGISNSGNLTVNNSTISNNSSPNGDGGGIANSGDLTVNNSTISNNSSPNGEGGGIDSYGSLYISNSSGGNTAHLRRTVMASSTSVAITSCIF